MPTDEAAAIPCSLILAGGLALGAYHAGVLRGIVESGRLDIRAIAGSSIGAITGAILAGNPRDRWVAQLQTFWDATATDGAPTGWLDPAGLLETRPARHARAWAGAALGRLAGAPNFFRLRWPGEREPGAPCASLYSNEPARALLARLIDWERIDRGNVRLCIATCDVERGEPLLFDTARGDRIGIDHLLASGGLMPSFSPVEIDGRLLGDGGFAMNAPLEPYVATDRADADWPVAILVDLFSPDAVAPLSLEASIARATDLQFAMQTRMRLRALEREWAIHARHLPDTPGIDLYHLRYRPPPHEAGSEKTYDFSRHTIRDRMDAGLADAGRLIDRLDAVPPRGKAGLRVHAICRDADRARPNSEIS